MPDFYQRASVEPPIATSDHNVILCRRLVAHDRAPIFKTVKSRNQGHNECTLFIQNLKTTNWTNMYRIKSCEDQFQFFNSIIFDY